MVAQNTVRTNGVSQVFRFVVGIWLHKKVVKSDIFRKLPILLRSSGPCSELPSYICTMVRTIPDINQQVLPYILDAAAEADPPKILFTNVPTAVFCISFHAFDK